jgi:N-acetyl-gamma-glutamyl-phosphate reductase
MNDYPVGVGVLGAGGYSGRELVALLAHHPRVRIVFATSESEAGTSLRRISARAPELAMVRAAEAPLGKCALVFCCLPHGEAKRWAEKGRMAGARVIDLSADLRVQSEETPEWARDAVYGLPEFHRERIRTAELVANPGCYPTAALLALAPLVRRGLIVGPVVINAASGVTGAGRSPKRELLFAEVADDFRAYGIGNRHRHLAEMRDQVAGLANGAVPELVFVPHLLPVQRGILETIHVGVSEPLSDPIRLWLDDYANEPFVDVVRDRMPSLRDVVGTNRVAIGVSGVDGVSSPLLQIIAAEDNLVKGAAGQAVQNMNVMFGWPETEALL